MTLASLSEVDLVDVIRLARALQAADAGRPEVLSSAEVMALRYGARQEPRQALVDRIAGLSDSARQELVALMYLGREGDHADFKEFVRSSQTLPPHSMGSFIASKSKHLPEYLEKGLALLRARALRP